MKDLLAAMEHRLSPSGFMHVWVGYKIILPSELSRRPGSDNWTVYMSRPGTEGISKLVEAFRELERLGDAIAVTVRATNCAPWVMPFTRCCLGIPPSIYLPDGKILLDQPASRVNLFICNNPKDVVFEIIV